jgi:para-nitrobenzyl esterase
MKQKITFLLLLMSLFHYCLAQVVTTQFGPIQGVVNGGVHQFLGVPFAKPPVNTLRWKAPQNPDSWSTVINTTSFAPVCPQKNFDTGGTSYTIEGNEDCLYLNIWTPQLTTPNLPVLVFIHGGGNQQGSASETNAGAQMFFGKNMAERGTAVIVTIQYRLGPLGFLVHPGLDAESSTGTSGNFAALDQLLALQWVQNNIAQFGGDATKVMVFGESAGGVNVGNLLTSPLATGLFQRAAIQSAVPVIETYATGTTKGTTYVNSFIATGTDADKIAYMRTLSSETLVANETAPISGGSVQSNWKAVMDGEVFTNFPVQSFQSGMFNKVPLLIGSNAEEMSLSTPATVTPGMVNLLINSTVPSGLQATAHALYPSGSTNEEAKVSYIGILSDSQFTATTRRTAQCVSANQTEPVWRYFFSYRHSIPALANYGSYHGMELFYVFNTWENTTLGSGVLFSANDEAVQDAMLAYWVNFATTGNPNGTGLTNWPQYDGTTDCYLEINETPNGTQCGLRTAKSNLWDSVVGFTPCTSSLGTTPISPIDTQLSVYPNPMVESVTVDFRTPTSLLNTIALYDIRGTLVRSFTSINSTTFSIKRDSLAAGLYFMKITDTFNNQYVKKILVAE